jgi:hypothetical protein
MVERVAEFTDMERVGNSRDGRIYRVTTYRSSGGIHILRSDPVAVIHMLRSMQMLIGLLQ